MHSIITALVFALALFVTFPAVRNIVAQIALAHRGIERDDNAANIDIMLVIVDCLLWGLFYYLSH